jgi:phosphatidate phosphatase PAH1
VTQAATLFHGQGLELRHTQAVRAVVLFAVVGLSACGTTANVPGEAGPPDGLARCAPEVQRASWRHHLHGGRVVSLLGEPRHVLVDAVAGQGQPVVVRGKFAYGLVSKDAEDETVEAWQEVEPCKWRPVGRAVTDDDGRATISVAASAFVGPGPHTVRMYLLGDRTYAEAKVWIVAPRTNAVLFDIDGTLTVDDGELFEELLGGSARMHPGADEVARRWADLGYLPVYITGRPYPLRGSTFEWLIQHRFPLGPVFTVDSVLDFLPSEGHVGEFKRRALLALIAAGLQVHRAYGNAATDVCAYARAGIPPELTYIVGAPRPGCPPFAAPRSLASYVQHLPEISDAERVR